MARRTFSEYTYSIRSQEFGEIGQLTLTVYDDKTQKAHDTSIDNLMQRGFDVHILNRRSGWHESYEHVMFPGRPFERKEIRWKEAEAA